MAWHQFASARASSGTANCPATTEARVALAVALVDLAVTRANPFAP